MIFNVFFCRKGELPLRFLFHYRIINSIIKRSWEYLVAPNFVVSQDIHNGNDKSEPVPHLEDSVRIIMRWCEWRYRIYPKNPVIPTVCGQSSNSIYTPKERSITVTPHSADGIAKHLYHSLPITGNSTISSSSGIFVPRLSRSSGKCNAKFLDRFIAVSILG